MTRTKKTMKAYLETTRALRAFVKGEATAEDLSHVVANLAIVGLESASIAEGRRTA